MSQEFLPILYFNMAGEMFYIIEQRLDAQNIEQSKKIQVLEDIAKAIFNAKLIEEIFKPHTMITFPILRSIFDKLAHSSIMRLNEQSMNKLFDLMVMVVKYQIYTCPMPSDLLVITDNHFVSLMETISENRELLQQIENIRAQFLHHYNTNFNLQSLQFIRYTLLNFFKDIHTRISIFLRNGLQSSEGRFLTKNDTICVNCECQIPGVIRYFRPDNGEILKTDNFNTESEFIVDVSSTTLGLNIYRNETDDSTNEGGSASDQESAPQKPQHNTEMDLLAMLIRRPEPETELELKFDFLENSVEQQKNEEKAARKANKVVEIVSNLSALQRNTELGEIFDDFQGLKILKENDSLHKTDNTKDQSLKIEDEIDYLELIDS